MDLTTNTIQILKSDTIEDVHFYFDKNTISYTYKGGTIIEKGDNVCMKVFGLVGKAKISLYKNSRI